MLEFLVYITVLQEESALKFYLRSQAGLNAQPCCIPIVFPFHVRVTRNLRSGFERGD